MVDIDNTNRVSCEEAHKMVSYDPLTGVFRWKVRSPWILLGGVAGYYATKYRYIKLHWRSYALHRLAWFMTYGRWPVAYIDHVDNNKLNNRIANLRDVSSSDNGKNIRMVSHNTSGVLGVT